MTVDYPYLAGLIRAGAVTEIVDALVSTDEKTRRALAPDLRRHMEEVWASDWQRRQAESWPVLVAGAGCMPGAAGVVSWLRHRNLRWELRGKDPEPLVRVLGAPGRPALAVVGRQLADRMRASTIDTDWRVAAAFLRAAGAEPATADAFVRGWARFGGRATDIQRRLPDALRADPWLTAMVGRMFEVDALAAELSAPWPEVLIALCAEGRVDRGAVLSGCLWRMRAGDRATAIGNVLKIHMLLAVTPDEVAAHRQEYLGLLSAGNGHVADHAQRALRDLPLPADELVDVLVDSSHAVLLRREKKLVRAQLAWLAATARRHPEHLARLLGAAATGLGNEATDLADRALDVIARHLRAAGDDGRKAVADALPELTGDLARRVAELLGDDVPAGPAPDDFVPLGEPVQEAPPPIGSLGELTGEVRRILRDGSDPIALERILDAAVRFAGTDRAALATALAPVVPGWGGQTWYGELCNVLRAAGGGQILRPEPPPHHREDPAPPEKLLTARLAEVADRLAAGPSPGALLATPATEAGHVDPERVLGLLVGFERDGIPAGPVDLTQALLRLPRAVDPSVVAAAAALRSPGGRLFHRWLAAGGLPDPAVTRVKVPQPECRSSHTAYYHGYTCYCMSQPAFRLIVDVPAPPPERADGLAVPDRLLHLPAGASARQRAYGHHWAPQMAMWPAVTPSHREIAAAHIQPMLAPAADQDRSGGTETLPALARCSGPFGPAMALALAYGLAARRERDRLPAVDALVLLAGRGELAGPLLGRELGELAGEGVIVLSRVVGALGEAARAGASGAVWDITAAMLPALLGRDKPRAGTPDLLALAASAAETRTGTSARAGAATTGMAADAEAGTSGAAAGAEAGTSGAGAGTSGAAAGAEAGTTGAGAGTNGAAAGTEAEMRALVAEVAGRRGGSRLVTEAKRLARVLG